MLEYEVFAVEDLGFIFSKVHEYLLDSYSKGHTGARVYLDSVLAHSYLKKWMPGWARRADLSGNWRNSQGNFQILKIIFEKII